MHRRRTDDSACSIMYSMSRTLADEIESSVPPMDHTGPGMTCGYIDVVVM